MSFGEGRNLRVEWTFEEKLDQPSWGNGKKIAGRTMFVKPLTFVKVFEHGFCLGSDPFFCFPES